MSLYFCFAFDSFVSDQERVQKDLDALSAALKSLIQVRCAKCDPNDILFAIDLDCVLLLQSRSRRPSPQIKRLQAIANLMMTTTMMTMMTMMMTIMTIMTMMIMM
jgi:hypothetical protein